MNVKYHRLDGSRGKCLCIRVLLPFRRFRTTAHAVVVCALELLQRLFLVFQVVTSLDFGDDSMITIIASTTQAQAERHPSKLKFCFAKIPGYFSGTGDSFASLLLYRLLQHPDQLSVALQKTLGSLMGILKLTVDRDKEACLGGFDADSCNRREICLVEGQDCLANPPEFCDPIAIE